jgi:hypothetical protein
MMIVLDWLMQLETKKDYVLPGEDGGDGGRQ